MHTSYFIQIFFFFRSKVDQIHEIVTGNPTVIKMVVSFNRGARGQNALRQILGPVVKEIIDDKSLNIKTDPVDIYKSWVNQMESQTGEARYGKCYYCDFLNIARLLCTAQLIIFKPSLASLRAPIQLVPPFHLLKMVFIQEFQRSCSGDGAEGVSLVDGRRNTLWCLPMLT